MWKEVAMSSSKATRSRVIEIAEAPGPDVLATALATRPGEVVSGEIVVRKAGGEISVDYPQNTLGPLPARTLVEDLHLGAKVLLAFDGGDPTRPIVLGVVHDR